MGLCVKDISFSYGSHKVLDSISFELGKGELLALLGENGTGKTTLLKSFSGILNPKFGETFVDDVNILNLSLTERSKIMSYVPQYTPSLFAITVMDMVMMGRQPFIRFRPSGKDKKIVFNILEKLELVDFAFRNVSELSGGERQRVFIARALAQEPKLLILDEPTSSMDIKNQLNTMRIIKELVCKHEIMAVVSIHDLNLASMFCDRFMFIKDGRVYSYGDNEKTITEENIYNVYNVNTCVSEVDDYYHIRLVK